MWPLQVVFNTSLAGYQEIMTDPSYKEQFVVFTCPHIGNVGINLGAQSLGCMHLASQAVPACTEMRRFVVAAAMAGHGACCSCCHEVPRQPPPSHAHGTNYSGPPRHPHPCPPAIRRNR